MLFQYLLMPIISNCIYRITFLIFWAIAQSPKW